MSHQCHQCKDWDDCPGKQPWYPPAIIRFCPNQVMWLLDHLAVLRDGRWPTDPQDTGYTDAPGPRPYKRGAYFETPVGIAAELLVRLGKCNRDGVIIRKWKVEGENEAELMELTRLNMYQIEEKLGRVVRYCSGWGRKRMSYHDFCHRHRLSERYRRGQ